MSCQRAYFAALLASSVVPANLPGDYTQAQFDRGGYSLTHTYWPGTPQAVTGQQWLSAASTLEKGLKQDGLWELLPVVYLFFGETPAQMLLNLKAIAGADVADGVAVSSASPAADPLGYRDSSPGANGWIDSQYRADRLNAASAGLGLYVTFDPNPSSRVQVDVGCYDGAHYFDLLVWLNDTAYYENDTGGQLSAAVGTSLGWTLGTRTGASALALYRNGAQLVTSTGTSNGQPAATIAIGARAGQPGLSSKRTFGFFCVTHGLTSVQNTLLYNHVQRYNSALSRQV